MDLKYLLIFTAMVGFAMGSAHPNRPPISLEDIKDALLGLVRMMRENTDKLERHETRDKQTADQLKRTISAVSKRMPSLDNMNGQLVKLNDRITGLENFISQKDERERIQLQKTADTLEDLENRLEGWATEIESKVSEASNRGPKLITDKLDQVLKKLDLLESKLDGMPGKFDGTKNTEYGIEIQPDKLPVAFEEVRDLCRKMHFDGEYNTDPKLSVQPLGMDKLQDLLQSTVEQMQSLPSMSDLKMMHNETQTTLQETQYALKNAIGLGSDNIERKLFENKEETQGLLATLGVNMKTNADRLNQDIKDLEKGQSVMIEMADDVLDTKKRLEHAYKILQEVGEMVMIQGMNMNNTLHSRFDGISNDIMDNQTGAMANLTSKMEQEINQVWRQINVMYQKMMENQKLLSNLAQQNEIYVNGTTNTMEGMDSKVGEITKRMTEVDKNLNYLLGRLSLVTQEFNQIKSGLGQALEQIKDSFSEVQKKANDLSNPGPHPLPQGYSELASSTENTTE